MRAGMGTKLSSSAGLNSLEQFQLLPAKYAERSGEAQGATVATIRAIQGQLNEYIANNQTFTRLRLTRVLTVL